MAIKSKSDLYRFRVFIFDLDNTIYNEEEYLFQGYAAVSRFIAGLSKTASEKKIYDELKALYLTEGRTRLFDKIACRSGLDNNIVKECVRILHSFHVEKQLTLNAGVKELFEDLTKLQREVFILTNGNKTQQENKVNNIDWGGLKGHIRVFYASEIEPKPSPAGVKAILSVAGCREADAVFIGDSEVDRLCASNSGIEYIDVSALSDVMCF